MTKETEFESQKNRKAFLYTAFICGTLLLLFIIISWKVMPPSIPVVQDLIEINLGNNENGYGEEQPLIKGERSPSQEAVILPKQSSPKEAVTDKVVPDENAPEDAATVNKPEKKTPKVKSVTAPAPVFTPVPKPQKPKVTYNGPGSGTGNGATEDNGFKNQGNNPNGKGDNGDPNGNKDSYGPGGPKTGGPQVIGNRKITNDYSFVGDLQKATVVAIVKVSPSGRGTFVKIDSKGSTTTDPRYARDIIGYLANVTFNKDVSESTVKVKFYFKEQ